MASPPSLIRSRALVDISNLYNLSDPFRALHPDRLDFSYRPRNGLPNRSRIDFFLISDSLLEHVSTVLVKTKGKHNNTVHCWSSLKGQVRKKVCYFSKWVVAYRPEQWTGLRLHIIRKTTFFPSIIKQENSCQNSFILKIYRHHFKGVYGPFNRRPICGG